MEPRQSAPELPRENKPLEVGQQYSFERPTLENAGEATHEVVGESPVRVETEALPPVIPLPAPIPAVQAAPVAASDDVTGSNPAVAGDDDVIEKEWVDKIKKVIEATKENPYQREVEIGKLQRDYIRKRYGREIGEPGDR